MMNYKNCIVSKNVKFPPEFFEDEIRSGFYVSTMTKRYWAGNLKVLSEISKICDRHKIRWFAFLGTLLGAVRHKGSIPWDDDMDICMLRKDYDRFFELAVNELPKDYVLLDVRSTEGFENRVGRVINRAAIDYSDAHMNEFMGCPYIVGVDIFVLDDIYDDNDVEEDRMRRLININKAIINIEDGVENDESLDRQLKIIEEDNNIKLKKGDDLKRELLLLSDMIYSEYSSESAEYVAVISALVSHGIGMYPKKIFKRATELLYENTYISAPEKYDDFLRIIYGNYMIIKKKGGSHDYPLYGKEEKLLAEKMGCNPFRYTLSKEELIRMITFRENSKSTNDTCMEMLNTIMEAIDIMRGLFDNDDVSGVMGIMEGCQELAIVLGTTIEERMPQSQVIVSLLETFCERIYELHESPNKAGIETMCREYCGIYDTISDFIKHRKRRILFLPCTSRWWDSMYPYYKKCLMDNMSEIYVLPLPYYEIYYDGNVEMISDTVGFPKKVDTMSVTEYDFEHGYADEIVIQIPYDEASTVIRVPKFFYSENLINYTDRLTYIPHLSPDDPEEGDERAVKALGVYIEQPAVVYSDKIILNSEVLKRVYLDKLTELAGEDTRDYWNDKLLVKG